MKLYDKQGYFNASEILKSKYKFIFCTGARGIGKTYSTIKYLLESKKPFIYLRRTQDESDLQANPNTSSITKVLNALKLDYEFKKLSKKVGVILIDGVPMVYTCALSTFASIRGVNFDNVDYAVYDEFITEPHVRTFKAEGIALMNFYESVNRNRELEEKEALTLICLSNSLNIANDIFMEFNLITDAERLTSTGIEEYARGDILLLIMQNSPISKLKSKTTLYLNASEEYARMAIDNDFILNDFSYVKKRNLKEYKIILNVGDLYLYKHKTRSEYYVTFVKANTKRKYTNSINDLERFKRSENKYLAKYLDGLIRFDSYKAVVLFEKYYK